MNYAIISERRVGLSKLFDHLRVNFCVKCREDTHFIGLNIYFSNIYPRFGGDPSRSFAIIDYGLSVIFPEHSVSHFITISTYLAVNAIPLTTARYFDKSPGDLYTDEPCNRLAIQYDLLGI